MVQHIFSQEKPVGDLELVMAFNGPMPTGVSVSHAGRVFVNFPRWDDPTDFTVAELREEHLQVVLQKCWRYGKLCGIQEEPRSSLHEPAESV